MNTVNWPGNWYWFPLVVRLRKRATVSHFPGFEHFESGSSRFVQSTSTYIKSVATSATSTGAIVTRLACTAMLVTLATLAVSKKIKNQRFSNGQQVWKPSQS